MLKHFDNRLLQLMQESKQLQTILPIDFVRLIDDQNKKIRRFALDKGLTRATGPLAVNSTRIGLELYGFHGPLPNNPEDLYILMLSLPKIDGLEETMFANRDFIPKAFLTALRSKDGGKHWDRVGYEFPFRDATKTKTAGKAIMNAILQEAIDGDLESRTKSADWATPATSVKSGSIGKNKNHTIGN